MKLYAARLFKMNGCSHKSLYQNLSRRVANLNPFPHHDNIIYYGSMPPKVNIPFHGEMTSDFRREDPLE